MRSGDELTAKLEQEMEDVFAEMRAAREAREAYLAGLGIEAMLAGNLRVGDEVLRETKTGWTSIGEVEDVRFRSDGDLDVETTRMQTIMPVRKQVFVSRSWMLSAAEVTDDVWDRTSGADLGKAFEELGTKAFAMPRCKRCGRRSVRLGPASGLCPLCVEGRN